MLRSFFSVLLLVGAGAFAQAQVWHQDGAGKYPADATPGGYEANGTPLYIIRGDVQGSIAVGKFNPQQRAAYVSYGGKEIRLSRYEVYTGGGKWIDWQAGSVPTGAIRGGSEADGTPLYIIRAPFRGGLVPGKYNARYGKGYIPYGGREYSLSRFQILVSDWAPVRGNLAVDGLHAGNEANGAPLLLIRTRWPNGSLQVGKYSTEYHMGYVPFGGVEHQVDRNLQVFTGSGVWVDASDGQVPFGAIPGGRSAAGLPIYMIRAPFQGGLVPGQLNLGTRRAVISYGGRWHIVGRYQVLCYDFNGRLEELSRGRPIAPRLKNPPQPRFSPQARRPRRNEPSLVSAAMFDPHKDRSIRSTRSVELVVENHWTRPVTLDWVGFHGREHTYALIRPGQVYRQQTYETHVWIVRFTNGGGWLFFRMGPQPTQVVVLNDGLLSK